MITYNSYTVNSPTPYANPKEMLRYYKKGTEEWGNPVLILDRKKITDANKISIFPNPSKNIFKVSNNDVIDAINIYDTHGKLVYSIKNIKSKETLIDLSKEKSGIYFLQIFTHNNYIAKKLIKK